MRMPIALWFLALVACGSPGDAPPARRAEVAAKGAQVMPFDLDKTRHHFEDLPDGGLQTVRVLDPADTLNLRLIREHLTLEAARFSRGEFDDPMAIHGQAMPGLAELKAGWSRISVAFAAANDGGQIRYATLDPTLVAALHRWFQAQRSDHGAHAR